MYATLNTYCVYTPFEAAKRNQTYIQFYV